MHEKLTFQNPELLATTLKDRFFWKGIPHITPDDLVNPDRHQSEGNTTWAYRIKDGNRPYSGQLLKILKDVKYLPVFATNISILNDLRDLHTEETYLGKEPSAPYAYSSGLFNGEFGFVESFIPFVHGQDTEEYLLSLGQLHIKQFLIDALTKLSTFQMMDIIQRDAGFANFGYNPETFNVTMIDFGSAFSNTTKNWWHHEYTQEESIALGILTFSHNAKWLCKKANLSKQEAIFAESEQNPQKTFTDLLYSIQKISWK